MRVFTFVAHDVFAEGRSMKGRPILLGMGADGVQRYFTVMAECALPSKLRLGAK